jgi:hypothetical protein
MDLKLYFRKIRDLRETITTPFVTIASLATADGGAEGVVSEVESGLACKLIVEGRARFATEEEAQTLREDPSKAARRQGSPTTKAIRP